MLEFILAFLNNLEILCFIFGLGFLIFSTISFFIMVDNCSFEKRDEIFKLLKRRLILTSLVFLFTTIPGPNEMFKMRIALIKYQLASPENIKASTETITRIAHELECKYLKCEDDKK